MIFQFQAVFFRFVPINIPIALLAIPDTVNTLFVSEGETPRDSATPTRAELYRVLRFFDISIGLDRQVICRTRREGYDLAL